MTIALDASAEGAHATSTNGDLTWTHTPVGSPGAVLVWVILEADGANGDRNMSITYGTESMTEVTGSPVLQSTGEQGSCYAFFLGTGLPTGAQTVTVSTDSHSSEKWGCSLTYTSDEDCEIVDVGTILSDSLLDPSVSLSLGGETSAAAIGFFSGRGAVVTANSGWTIQQDNDGGPNVQGVHTYDTIGTADVTAGYTAAADDVAAIAIAFKEAAAASGSTGQRINNGLIR